MCTLPALYRKVFFALGVPVSSMRFPVPVHPLLTLSLFFVVSSCSRHIPQNEMSNKCTCVTFAEAWAVIILARKNWTFHHSENVLRCRGRTFCEFVLCVCVSLCVSGKHPTVCVSDCVRVFGARMSSQTERISPRGRAI